MPDSLQIVHQFYPKVKRVINAKHGVWVSLTQRDIDKAKRKDHNGCAMVEACKRMEHVDGAIVSKRTAYLIRGDTAERFFVNERILREITSFDRGGTFATGDYALHKPYRPLPRGSKTRHTGSLKAGVLRHRDISHTVENVRQSLLSLSPKRKKK